MARAQRENKFIKLADLVLVRQKPGSAKGVMLITLEDESGVANLVIWPSLYEKQRRLILTVSMMGVEGRVQREGDVVHVVVMRLHDLSGELAGRGEREPAFPCRMGVATSIIIAAVLTPAGNRPGGRPRQETFLSSQTLSTCST